MDAVIQLKGGFEVLLLEFSYKDEHSKEKKIQTMISFTPRKIYNDDQEQMMRKNQLQLKTRSYCRGTRTWYHSKSLI